MAGRPTDYRDTFNDQAYKLCLLGATDKDLADFFEVCEDTVNEWKKVHPEFSVSIKRGKELADAEVAASLYKRATGYTSTEVHRQKVEGQTFDLEVDGEGLAAVPSTEDTVLTKVITKEVPPDVTAQIFWLKNRKKAVWRDKSEVEQSGQVALAVSVSKEEAKEIAEALQKDI